MKRHVCCHSLLIGLVSFAGLALLAGCAGMNTSVMETADVLEPGHIEFGAEYNLGLEMASTVFLEDDTSDQFTAEALAGADVWGVWTGIGLGKNLEADGMLWASFGGSGGKISVKYRLSEPGARTAYAIAPGVTFVTTDSTDDEEGSLEDDLASITSRGLEIPFILTRKLHERISVTGVARYSVDFVDISYPDDSALAYLGDGHTLHRFGLINGWCFRTGGMSLRPEFGVELASQVNGSIGIVPIIAVGVGFDF